MIPKVFLGQTQAPDIYKLGFFTKGIQFAIFGTLDEFDAMNKEIATGVQELRKVAESE